MSLALKANGRYQGLTEAEVLHQRAQSGPNEIKQEATRSPVFLLFDQFKSPLVLILVFACVFSAILGEWIESIAIASILVLNALIGFFQEYRAENAVLALKKMTAPRATVVRDGQQRLISARDVVPSDILLLEAGDIVAADAKILNSSRLQVNEAILTGESTPVEKTAQLKEGTLEAEGRTEFVYMGTTVLTGTAITQVASTGMATELGKIANLITVAETSPTPLQVQLAKVGRMLLLLCLGIVGVVTLLGILHDRPWVELLIFSISLAVAAVPEGMPAIVTVALALGVQRMAARNALIRKLPSVETLGSVSVICTDKTGTLTTGKMTVREIYSDNKQTLLNAAASCTDAQLAEDDSDSGAGDPTEIAILRQAAEQGSHKDRIERENPRKSSEPFDSDRKRMSIFRQDGKNYVKGAVESILPLCNVSDEKLISIQRVNQEMTSRALRVLAIAVGRTPVEKDLDFLGLIGIADPPRPEATTAIAEARQAGITPIMITGDHPGTAAVIARELGLVLESETVEGRVYARATPEDKLKLVRDWKHQGAIVAMTGDGVNDAPALREAHIGIAMGKGGTEVTRQSADLILADDNFATIVAAVKEGRAIYRNIQKAIVYLLTGNFAELAVVLGASALGLPLPFLAAHLLWINLVTDSLPALALIADPAPKNAMKRAPRKSTELLLGTREWLRIAWVGTIEAIVVFAVFVFVFRSDGIESARGIAFSTIVFSQLWRAFGARSKTLTFWKLGALSNLWLLGVVAFTGSLQLSLHFLPLTQRIFGLKVLNWRDFGWIMLCSITTITLVELNKMLKARLRRKSQAPIKD